MSLETALEDKPITCKFSVRTVFEWLATRAEEEWELPPDATAGPQPDPLRIVAVILDETESLGLSHEDHDELIKSARAFLSEIL